MPASCPYCNSVRSMLLGNVYCSNHSHIPMQQLQTGVLYIDAKKMEETAEHISRLSIRYSLKGEQYYRIGSNDHLINPEKYVIVNQGQRYKTAFETNEDHEMILVAFKPGFAEEVLHDLLTPDDQLLDNPAGTHAQPVHFFEHTYEADPVIVQYFQELKRLMNADEVVKAQTDLADLYSALMRQMLITHRDTRRLMQKLPVIKTSTRAELYRRLCIARDHLDAHTSENIPLAGIAAKASLSVHHFKRSFTQVFGISPHQYHIEQRLKKALALSKQKKLSSSEICTATGFENTSSFIRLFKQKFGTTPGRMMHEPGS